MKRRKYHHWHNGTPICGCKNPKEAIGKGWQASWSDVYKSWPTAAQYPSGVCKRCKKQLYDQQGNMIPLILRLAGIQDET